MSIDILSAVPIPAADEFEHYQANGVGRAQWARREAGHETKSTYRIAEIAQAFSLLSALQHPAEHTETTADAHSLEN